MVYKRVRGSTSGRSLPVKNFFGSPPPPGLLNSLTEEAWQSASRITLAALFRNLRQWKFLKCKQKCLVFGTNKIYTNDTLMFITARPNHIYIIYYRSFHGFWKISRCFRGRQYLILLKMPIRCESFLHNLSTWGINVSSWSISRPKSFAQQTFSSCFALTTTARSCLILVESRLPVMVSTFVLPSFRGSLLAVAHWSTRSEIAVVSELCKTPTKSKLTSCRLRIGRFEPSSHVSEDR